MVGRVKQVDEPDQEWISQRKRPETGRFLVRVDRQTKSSHATADGAIAAGQDIKRRYPVVQVGVFDAEERTTTVVEVPVTE